MSRRSKSSDDLGCLPIAVLAIIAMPLVGVYIISTGDKDSKILGWILLIVGIIFWIWMWIAKHT